MGYSVKIVLGSKEGYLFRGRFAEKYSRGTYYNSPSAALRSATAWVGNHPEGKAFIYKYRTENLINFVIGDTFKEGESIFEDSPRVCQALVNLVLEDGQEDLASALICLKKYSNRVTSISPILFRIEKILLETEKEND